MEYLQYIINGISWYDFSGVLNLIINGIPSIPELGFEPEYMTDDGFKPYYKWNTFNTEFGGNKMAIKPKVLNLIINGIPSILAILYMLSQKKAMVLNLIINGIPSIQRRMKNNESKYKL